MTDTAYTDGYQAALWGHRQHANPHKICRAMALWWLKGWQEGRQEYQQKRQQERQAERTAADLAGETMEVAQ